MSEWKEYKLGNIATFSQGIQIDIKNQFNENFEDCVRFIRIVDFTKGAENEIRYIKNPGEKYIVKSDDLVMIRYGSQTAGKIARGFNGVIANNMFKISLDENKSDKNFIYFFLSQQSIYNFFHNSQSSSTMPAITFGMIGDLDIELPPLPEQTAIASVLSSLDDKIDLLHRQNATLEKMAETLFRQWFVEEAKEEWEEVKIKDFDIVVTDFVANGSFASLKENVTLINDGPGYALFIRNTDLKSDFTQKVFVDEHAYNFLSKTKLFGGEVIISSVGDVGSVFRCPKFRIPMTLGNNVVMLKSKYNNFFYLFFNSDYGQSLIYGITSGSVQEKFNKTTFRDISIKYPSLDYIEEFEKLIKPYFDKIDNNKTQIRTLTTLRDTLLPKLMSGEVRVEF